MKADLMGRKRVELKLTLARSAEAFPSRLFRKSCCGKSSSRIIVLTF